MSKLYETIIRNRKFKVDVLDPESDRRDHIRITVFHENGAKASHHLRADEVARLIKALKKALRYGPAIPER